MRVGVIALQHESNTFLAAPTTLEDFRRGTLVTGPELLRIYADAHHEVGGFLEGLRDQWIEPVPIFAAAATPGGTVGGDTYRYLLNAIMQAIDGSGPLDGLLVAPHGAGVSENEPDMDGHWLTTVRRRVGKDMPIICTLDLHANVSPRMIEACDATIAYRTNPHLDQRQRGLEAARLMGRMLRGEVRPAQAAAFPPVAINIAAQETDVDPARALVEQADLQHADGAVLSNSVLFGFPYADVAEMGSSIIVVTDGDAALARSRAADLALWLVRNRHRYRVTLPSVQEAVERAARTPGPVCLLDVGDNIGGGSPGDATLIAHELYSRGIGRSFVCLNDPARAAQCRDAGVGATLQLDMGGKTDGLHGPPLRAIATVASLHDGKFSEREPRHGGRTRFDMGPTAVVETDRGLTVMLSSFRTPPFSLNQLISCGIEPASFQVLVAKGVNAPIAAYRAVCKSFIRVNTPGVTTADMSLLPFHHRRRPLFPFEELRGESDTTAL
jgi:microcystin degradation protein MlrC